MIGASEGTDAKEKVQGVHEWPHLAAVDPDDQGVAPDVQRAAADTHQQPGGGEHPQGRHQRDQGQHGCHEQEHDHHQGMARDQVVEPPAKEGTEHVAQRVGGEKKADGIQ